MFNSLPSKTTFIVKLLLFVVFAASRCTPDSRGNLTETDGTAFAPAFSTPEANTPAPPQAETSSQTAAGAISTTTRSSLPTPSVAATSATFTPRPIPTLSVEEKGKLLSELMLNNGGCELPCW